MEIKCFKSLWEYIEFEGSPLTFRFGANLESVLERISRAGYRGIEAPLPNVEQEPLFRKLLADYNLEFIAQVVTDGSDHAISFDSQARRAATFDPIMIVSQSGRDRMSFEEKLGFYTQVLETEQSIGLPSAHETHRGRALFTPWGTAELLERLEGLKINADFSHWCCVTESLMEELGDAMNLAMRRAIHIHGRVGHSEGPQVADPRAPEYARELAAHEKWWKQIVLHRLEQGAAAVTFTPEFGPPSYMPTLPYTRQPLADLWEINLWMKERFEQLAKNVMQERRGQHLK